MAARSHRTSPNRRGCKRHRHHRRRAATWLILASIASSNRQRYYLVTLDLRPAAGDFIAIRTIVFTHRAAKELDTVPQPARLAIGEALNGYAVSGQGDVKELSGREGYRMRVGSYRVVFAEDATTILAIYVGRRSTTTY